MAFQLLSENLKSQIVESIIFYFLFTFYSSEGKIQENRKVGGLFGLGKKVIKCSKKI